MTMEDRENLFYQKQVARQVTRQMHELIAQLSKGLTVHKNIGQGFSMKTASVIMSLDSLSTQALVGNEIAFVSNARIRLPSTLNRSFDTTRKIYLRVRFFFLAKIDPVDLVLCSRHSNHWHRLANRDHRRIRGCPRRSR